MDFDSLKAAIERGDRDAVLALCAPGEAIPSELIRLAVRIGRRAVVEALGLRGGRADRDMLNIALAGRHLVLIDLLEQFGAVPDQSLMREAARDGYARAVKFLHRRGLALDYDDVVVPALMAGATEIVRYCAENGVDLSRAEADAFTLATDPRTSAVVELLDGGSGGGRAAVVAPLARHLYEWDVEGAHRFVARRDDPVTVIEYLLWRFGDRRPDREPLAGLLDTVRQGAHWLRAATVGDVGVIRALLRFEPAFPAADRVAALRLAALNGQQAVVALLHEAGVAIPADAAALAAANGWLTVVAYLGDRGADLAHADWASGRGALRGLHLDMLRFLHGRGLPLASLGEVAAGLTVVPAARDVLAFFEAGTGSTGYVSAWQAADEIRSRSTAGAAPALAEQAAGAARPHLLALAAETGDGAMVRELAGRMPDIARDGLPALARAAAAGHIETVRDLAACGVDPGAGDGQALRAATGSGHLAVVRHLVESGVPAAAADGDCLAALQLDGHHALYGYLATHGADALADLRPLLDAAAAEVEDGPPAYRLSNVARRRDQMLLDRLARVGIERFKRAVGDRRADPRRFALDGITTLEAGWPGTRIALYDPDQDARSESADRGQRFFESSRGRGLHLQSYRKHLNRQWLAAAAHDPLGLTEWIGEPRIGAPVEAWLDGRLVSSDLAVAIVETNALLASAEIPLPVHRPFLMVLGTDHGALAYAMAEATGCRLAIVDTAPALAIATYYLRALYPGRRVFPFRRFSDFEAVRDAFEAAEIAFLTPNQIEHLPDHAFDWGASVGYLDRLEDDTGSCLAQMKRVVRTRLYLKGRPTRLGAAADLAAGGGAGWTVALHRPAAGDPERVEALLTRPDPAPATPGSAAAQEPERVALLIPNYNHARYLPLALEGALRQTRPFDEIIVVDDGSDDESAQVVEAFRARDARIRFVSLEGRRGQHHAIQRALREATADFVVCAAADDLLLPRFVERNLAVLRRYPEAGLCLSRFATWADGTAGVTEYAAAANGPAFDLGSEPDFLPPGRLIERLERDHLWIAGNTVVARRRYLLEIGGFERDLRWHADWFAYYTLALRHGAATSPDTLALLRVRPDSYSAAGLRSEAEQHAVLRSLVMRLGAGRYHDVRLACERAPGILSVFGDNLTQAMADIPPQERRTIPLAQFRGPSQHERFGRGLTALKGRLLTRERGAPSRTLTGPERDAVWQAFYGGDHERAIALCEAHLQDNVRDRDIPYVMGMVLRARGDLDGALRQFDQALKLGSDPNWTRVQRARVLLAQGKPGAQSELRKAARSEGTAAEEAKAILANYGREELWATFHRREFERVVQLGERLLARDTAAIVPYVIGLALQEIEPRRAEAVPYFTSALAKGAGRGWCFFHRGRLRVQLGDAGGWDDIGRARDLGGDPSREATSFVNNHEKRELWEAVNQRRLDLAAEIGWRMLGRGSEDPDVHYVLGLALQDDVGRRSEALEQFDLAIAKGFNSSWGLVHRGRLRLDLGDGGGVDDLRRCRDSGGEAGQIAEAILSERGIVI